MWPLRKILIVTTIVQYVKLEDDTSSSLENVETLPQPSALASAERSSLDEEQYNVSVSLSLPYHHLPSFTPFSQLLLSNQTFSTQTQYQSILMIIDQLSVTFSIFSIDRSQVIRLTDILKKFYSFYKVLGNAINIYTKIFLSKALTIS